MNQYVLPVSQYVLPGERPYAEATYQRAYGDDWADRVNLIDSDPTDWAWDLTRWTFDPLYRAAVHVLVGLIALCQPKELP